MMANRRGQSTVEYAVVAAVVIGALLAMQIYMKRGAMGRLRDATDQLGEQFNPHIQTSTITNTYNVGRKEVTSTSGQVTSSITQQEKQTRTGTEAIDADLKDDKLFFNNK